MNKTEAKMSILRLASGTVSTLIRQFEGKRVTKYAELEKKVETWLAAIDTIDTRDMENWMDIITAIYKPVHAAKAA